MTLVLNMSLQQPLLSHRSLEKVLVAGARNTRPWLALGRYSGYNQWVKFVRRAQLVLGCS